jgi:hypothetical protein
VCKGPGPLGAGKGRSWWDMQLRDRQDRCSLQGQPNAPTGPSTLCQQRGGAVNTNEVLCTSATTQPSLCNRAHKMREFELIRLLCTPTMLGPQLTYLPRHLSSQRRDRTSHDLAPFEATQ